MFPILMHAEENGNLWHDFLAVAFDPAHVLAELFFTIVFDGIVIALLWGIVFKRFLLPRMRRQIHREIDQEHGIKHIPGTSDTEYIEGHTHGD